MTMVDLPPPHEVFDWVSDSVRRTDRAGLTRTFHARPATSDLIDLASNDYLRLANHPAVVESMIRAATTWGGGATGSRLVTGTTALHTELEEELADMCGVEAALVFSSGYLANLGVLTALCRPGSLIVADEHNHASLVDGYRMSGAELVTYRHADLGAAGAALASRAQARAMLITESVFSVDGDLADLPSVLATAREHGAAVLVDDAHGFGVIGDRGEGGAAAAGLAGLPDVVVTMTMSKALGAQGGAVLGPERIIRHITNTARTFLFDAGLAPATTAAALAALRTLRSEPDRPARARAAAKALFDGLSAAGLPVNPADGAVISVRAPSADAAVQWAAACKAKGVAAGCFRPPSVPDRFSRLRMTAHAELDAAHLSRAVEVIVETSPW